MRVFLYGDTRYVFEPRGVRQMDAQAHPLGSLPAGIRVEPRIPSSLNSETEVFC